MAIGKEGNVKWVDGLRGLASSLVVLTHVARGLDEQLFDPAVGRNGDIRFLQQPYVRVFVQGRLGVAIFSMVTGYVCALKPIKLSRQGNQEGAINSMTKSALRRTPRLVLPTTIATLLIWFAAQFGLFRVAKHTPNWWMTSSSPSMFPTLHESVLHLVRNIISTWTNHVNSYDPNQWTILPLLQGSMNIYVFCLATCYMVPRYRMMTAFAMWTYYYMSKDPSFGMQFFWGAFLADLQDHPPAIDFLSSRPCLCRVLAIICLTVGLTFCSLPERNFEWTSWSQSLQSFLKMILPKDPDYSHFSTGLGLELISLAIHVSPFARNILSNRHLLWLGKQSFAVYLLHGPLIRTVLCWMVFGFGLPEKIKTEEGQVEGRFQEPSGAKILACLPFWLVMTYAMAVVWTTYVDPFCARVTETLVSYVKDETDEKPVLPNPVR